MSLSRRKAEKTIRNKVNLKDKTINVFLLAHGKNGKEKCIKANQGLQQCFQEEADKALKKNTKFLFHKKIRLLTLVMVKRQFKRPSEIAQHIVSESHITEKLIVLLKVCSKRQVKIKPDMTPLTSTG